MTAQPDFDEYCTKAVCSHTTEHRPQQRHKRPLRRDISAAAGSVPQDCFHFLRLAFGVKTCGDLCTLALSISTHRLALRNCRLRLGSAQGSDQPVACA